MSIIRSVNNIASADFLLLKWEVTYNSKSYLEIDFHFNSDLNQIDVDYAHPSYGGASGTSGIKVYLIKNVGVTTTEYQLNKIYSTSGSTYNYTDTETLVSVSVKPKNNVLKAKFEYTQHSNTYLVDDSDSSVNYTLRVKVHEGASGSRDFNLSSINNKWSDDPFFVEQATFSSTSGLLNLIGSTTQYINGNAYRFDTTDRIKITPAGLSDGIQSNATTPAINNNISSSTVTNYGKVWNSSAGFSFTTSTGLSNNYDLNIDSSNKLKCNVFKNGTSFISTGNNPFNIDYSSLRCMIDNSVENTVLTSFSGTNATHNLFIPVLKDISSNNITVGFSDSSNTIINNSLNTTGGTYTVSAVTGVAANGVLSFSLTYNSVTQIPTGGSAWGKIIVSGTNGNLILYKPIEFEVRGNQPPTATIKTPDTPSSGTAGQTITLVATVTDDEGVLPLANIEFYDGAALIGIATGVVGNDYSINWSTGTTGAHTITAKADDNRGGSTTSSGHIINIT